MREIGSSEAKTCLPELLRAVEQGETILIKRRGKPIARLVPAEEVFRHRVEQAIAHIKAARAQRPAVRPEEIRAWRHEGHSY